MTQNPPNSGWQPSPQGPQQPQWTPTGQPPQQGFGPQGQPGYGPQGQPGFTPQQPGYGNQPPQGQPGYSPQGPQNLVEPKKKSKTPVIIAAVVALALVVGGVIFALTFFRGATPAAAKGLPADALMAFEVNLAPSTADKLALKSIIEKFPVDTSDAGDDYKEALWDLIPDSEDKPDYESEIKPWLGDSVAIALLNKGPESLESDASPIVAVETTDQGKAEEFAQANLDGAKYFFIDSLLVFMDEDETITADDITGNSLADSEEYQDDLAKLGDGFLATAWFSSSLMDLALEQAQDSLYGNPGFDVEQLRGIHGAMGLQAGDDMVTLKAGFHTPNAPDATPDDIRDFTKALSGDALVVFAGSTTEALFTQYWELISETPDVRDAAAQLGITSAADLEALIGKHVGITLSMPGSEPAVGAKLETEDADKQRQILDQLDELLLQSGSTEQVAIEQDGNTAIVAFGQSIDDVANPATRLGDVEAFGKVVDGPAQSVLFVNFYEIKALQAYEEMLQYQDDQTREWLEPITAIGLTSTQGDDKYAEAFIRVTLD